MFDINQKGIENILSNCYLLRIRIVKKAKKK